MSKQTIFDQLRKAGCTEAGALALMGNWQEESNLESCRLQGDFQNDRYPSRLYSDRVDNGRMTEELFIRDGKGWGLAQWTFWTRKKGLLQFCRKRGASISNETAQVDFAVAELKQDYPAVWDYLTTANMEHLHMAAEMVCKQYECPAYNNIEVRYKAAVKLKDELKLLDVFWPPRMICNGMSGADVAVLQALLIARGYTTVEINNVFDDNTEKALRDFQEKKKLDVDGICGPKSWAELLKGE